MNICRLVDYWPRLHSPSNDTKHFHKINLKVETNRMRLQQTISSTQLDLIVLIFQTCTSAMTAIIVLIDKDMSSQTLPVWKSSQFSSSLDLIDRFDLLWKWIFHLVHEFLIWIWINIWRFSVLICNHLTINWMTNLSKILWSTPELNQIENTAIWVGHKWI